MIDDRLAQLAVFHDRVTYLVHGRDDRDELGREAHFALHHPLLELLETPSRRGSAPTDEHEDG